MEKRKIKVAVISDVHLGTYGCHANELLTYLKSIDPVILILNGDIIDIWQLSRYYFPESHWRVVQRLVKMMGNGTHIYYLTGNHDEMLRKFSDTQLDRFHLQNKLVIDLDGKKHWFFHGDVFDRTMRNSKWLAKLGGSGYDFLILINRLSNLILRKLGKEPYSFSKRIKQSVKAAMKHISRFEETVAEIAVHKKYDYAICGHIHDPVVKELHTKEGSVIYMNSGDWIENLSVLEYNESKWELKFFHSLGLQEITQPLEELETRQSKVPFQFELSHIMD